MKIQSLVLTALLSAVGITAIAQGNPVTQVKKDNAVIRHDNKEIRTESKDIHRDNVGINKDKHDIAHDANVIKTERHDAQRDQRLEDAAIAKGDLKDAQKLDKARQHETNDIKAAQRDIHRDKGDLAHDRKDRNKDAAARADELRERNAVVVKRNQDAGNIH